MRRNQLFIKGNEVTEKLTIAYELTILNKPIDEMIERHEKRLKELLALRPIMISEIIMKERLF